MFLNAVWKFSVGLFRTACSSASITSVVSEWRIFYQGQKTSHKGLGQLSGVGGEWQSC
jgi:hypothetical protein